MVEKRILKGLCALFVLMASTYSYGMRDAEVGSRRAAQKRHFYGIDAAGLGGGALDSGEFARDIAKRARFEESYGVDIDEKEAADQDAQFGHQGAQALNSLAEAAILAERLPEVSREKSVKPFECDLCGRRFVCEESLHRHCKKHARNKLDARKKLFELQGNQAQKAELSGVHGGVAQKMVSAVESAELFTCDLCPKRFASQRNLDRHRKKHTGYRPHGCNDCSKRFFCLSDLKRHQKIHASGKSIEIQKSLAEESGNSGLDQYEEQVKTHTNERWFACTQCHKNFPRLKSLKRHRLLHIKEGVLACDQCNKRFSNEGSFRNHMTIHVSKKPFACTLCHERFARPDLLPNHMKIHTAELQAQG